MYRSFASSDRACPAEREGKRAGVIAVMTLVAAVLATGCGENPPSLRLIPEAGPMGVARLAPKNGSTVRGLVSFTQRGERVVISGTFVELYPGPHSIYIHTVGNCGSPNAASAGPVWNVDGAAASDKRGKRIGDLPQRTAGSEGRSTLQIASSDVSVGTGKPNDVLGHAVVIHATVDPNPKAEFGVPNGWLACGVIERSTGLDLKSVF